MAATKFKDIYEILKKNIKNKKYNSTMRLPTEMELIKEFECSRNTIRRAINELIIEGLVTSVKGKGVIVLENNNLIEFPLHNLIGLKERGKKENNKFTTSVIHFSEITIDKELSEKTSLKEGTEVYHIQRIRYLNNEAMILDINYFDKSIVRDLSVEIAQDSIYEYIENSLGTKIQASRKVIIVQLANSLDKTVLDLGEYNCVAVIKNYAYTQDGKLFEYSESRHKPDKFEFIETNSKRKRF